MLGGSAALGYIVTGLLAFVLGVCVTIACFRICLLHRWVNFIPFNREYRPEVLEHASLVTVINECCGKPGEVIGQIAEMGFKTVTIIDPGVKLDPGYAKYDEGIAGDYFAKTPEGEVYVNAVWPGDAVYPDFGKPAVRAWWADNQKYLVDLGVRGVWNDMNEPVNPV